MFLSNIFLTLLEEAGARRVCIFRWPNRANRISQIAESWNSAGARPAPQKAFGAGVSLDAGDKEHLNRLASLTPSERFTKRPHSALEQDRAGLA